MVEEVKVETPLINEEVKDEQLEDVELDEDDQVKIDQDDLEDEAEIQKLIKEEDINLVPEDLDVSEIDKLTGIPRPGGKTLLTLLTLLRPTSVWHSDAGPLHHDQHF